MGTHQLLSLRFVSLLISHVVLILAMSVVTVRAEDKSVCDTDLVASFNAYLAGKTSPDEEVRKIQQQLLDGGYASEFSTEKFVDGKIGKNTYAALKQFCIDFQIQGSDNLARNIRSVLEASTDEVLHPPQPFYRWPVASNPPPDEAEDKKKVRSEKSAMEIKPDGILLTEPVLKILTEFRSKLSEIEGVTFSSLLLFRSGLEKLELKQLLEKLKPEISDPDSATEEAKLNYSDIESKILKLAKVQPLDPSNLLRLQSDGCGCSSAFSKLVYGFYPYWFANKKNASKVDFSALDRIGFYALTLTNETSVSDFSDLLKAVDFSGFIKKAHQYRVDVDTTVYAQNWENWEAVQINNAAKIILTLLQPVSESNIPAPIGDIFSLVDDNADVTSDGINLYFPLSSDSPIDQMIIIIQRVIIELETNNLRDKLNIIIDLNWNGIDLDWKSDKEKGLFEKLNDSLYITSDKKSKINNIFAFLPAPTSDNKKKLRRLIEDTFTGKDRRNLLRRVIPVIATPDTENDSDKIKKQFVDDLPYLEDNFAGVGLWPLPVAIENGNQQTSVNFEIKNEFKISKQGPWENIDNGITQLCTYVCPNRRPILMVIILVAGLLFLCRVCAIWGCGLRPFFKKYFWWFFGIGAVDIVALIVLACDLIWREYILSAIFAIFAVTVIVTFSSYGLNREKSALP